MTRASLHRSIALPSRQRPRRWPRTWLSLAAAALLASGCAGTANERPDGLAPDRWHNLAFEELFEARPGLTDEDLPYSYEREMAFFTGLVEKPVASMADALTAFVLFLGESPWDQTPEQLRTALAARGVARDTWPAGWDDPLTKGKLGYMVCGALDVRGGLWMTLFGPSERYALKEATYLDLVPPSSVHRYVTGPELLNTLSQADLYRTRQGRSLLAEQ